MHQQRRSNEQLVPSRVSDGVEWRTRAIHAALQAVLEPPYCNAMAMMLTRLFQSPANRLGEVNVLEPCCGEAQMQGPGQNARARRLSAAAVQHAGLLLGAGEDCISQGGRPAAIDLTESNNSKAGENGSGNDGATGSKAALTDVVQEDPLLLELSDSDLQ